MTTRFALATTIACAGMLATGDVAATEPQVAPTGNLTLTETLRLVDEHSPSLAAARLGLLAAEQRLRQARLWPNPELELEAEELGGPGELSGLRSAEVTALLSQQLLLGGKLANRRSLAGVELRLADLDRKATHLDLTARATLGFQLVLLAQEKVALAGEMLELAHSFADTVRKRVEAGKVSPVEAVRASTQVAAARTDLEQAEHELAASRRRLVAAWGDREADFDRAVGELPRAEPPQPLAALRLMLAQAPEMQQQEEQVRRHRLELQVARAERIPDLTISVGPRHQREAGITTWVAGLSIPLPLLDRNQGERQAAAFEVEQAQHRTEALRADLDAALAATVAGVHSLVAEIRALEDEIIPAATQVFETIRLGYQEGKLGFLDVLDAQRELSEARQQRLAAYSDYLMLRTEIDRMLGQYRLPTPRDPGAEND
jgi:cobalt-zinc-cadmium efflux system outer membrane protein